MLLTVPRPFDGSAAALEAWFETHRQALSPDSDPSIANFLRPHLQSGDRHELLGILAAQGHIHAERIGEAVTMLLALVDGLAISGLFAPAAEDGSTKPIVAE